ncbi:hypothetical protein LCGC14_2606320 [marine sediment metagenome]|uniref:Uncharacterized protein n=1 Tax=marine sediment metagenome TaxID=412755 RepID=A0A0F9A755_9ZZZZ
MLRVIEFYDRAGILASKEFQEALNNQTIKRTLKDWKMGVGGENETIIVAIFEEEEDEQPA